MSMYQRFLITASAALVLATQGGAAALQPAPPSDDAAQARQTAPDRPRQGDRPGFNMERLRRYLDEHPEARRELARYLRRQMQQDDPRREAGRGRGGGTPMQPRGERGGWQDHGPDDADPPRFDRQRIREHLRHHPEARQRLREFVRQNPEVRGRVGEFLREHPEALRRLMQAERAQPDDRAARRQRPGWQERGPRAGFQDGRGRQDAGPGQPGPAWGRQFRGQDERPMQRGPQRQRGFRGQGAGPIEQGESRRPSRFDPQRLREFFQAHPQARERFRDYLREHPEARQRLRDRLQDRRQDRMQPRGEERPFICPHCDRPIGREWLERGPEQFRRGQMDRRAWDGAGRSDRQRGEGRGGFGPGGWGPPPHGDSPADRQPRE